MPVAATCEHAQLIVMIAWEPTLSGVYRCLCVLLPMSALVVAIIEFYGRLFLLPPPYIQTSPPFPHTAANL